MLKNSDEVTHFQTNNSINVKGNLMIFDQTKIMGIVNATPDSYIKGSRIESETDLLKKVEKMLNDGADIIDLGGYSTRPGAQDVDIQTECQRIDTYSSLIKKTFPTAVLSLDTFRSEVAKRGLNNGVDMINDVSAGEMDSELPNLVAEFGVPYIIMHMRGTPQTMMEDTKYENVCLEVMSNLSEKIRRFRRMGIIDIIADPGIGFSKTVDQNFAVLRNIELFKELNVPLLLGVSKKSLLRSTFDIQPEQALSITSSLHTYLINKGINILRVHDVKEAKQCVELNNLLTK